MRMVNKILIGLLLIFSTVLSAQYYVTDGNGNHIVYYGSFTKATTSTIIIEDEEVQFDIIDTWDFETETAGIWTELKYQTYFGSQLGYEGYYSPKQGKDLYFITEDEIYPGISNKALWILNPANELYHGLESNITFPGDLVYQEIYITFHFKFGEECYPNHGGKMIGFEGIPRYGAGNLPLPGYAASGKVNFSYNKIYDYHYDQTKDTWAPWSHLTGIDYELDSIWPTFGDWYEYTIRYVVQSVDGVENGIMEVWINGRMIVQVDYIDTYDNQTDIDNLGINAVCIDHFYGGSGLAYNPMIDMAGSVDNVIVYRDTSHSTWGTYNLHDPDEIITTPLTHIRNTEMIYDSLITSEITGFVNTPFDTCVDNSYLIRAAEGQKVYFEITTTAWGGSDYLYFIDGSTTNDPYLYVRRTSSSDISQTIVSTDREMYVRFSAESNYDGGADYNLTGNITFNDPSGFTIIEEWDWNGETLGDWTNAEMTTWGASSTSFYPHNEPPDYIWNIVTDTINDVISNAMRIKHHSGVTDRPSEMRRELTSDHDTLFFTYNLKFSPEWTSTGGGKMFGLRTLIGANCEPDDAGFLAGGYFKEGGTFNPYYYEHSYPAVAPSCPWAPTQNTTMLFNYGNWYNLTQMVIMNTFDGVTPQYDGIVKWWLDGVLFYEDSGLRLVETESSTYKINGLWFANFFGPNEGPSLNDCYLYVDNASLWIPDVWDTDHSTIETPDEITDKDFYYNQTLIDNDATNLSVSAPAAGTNFMWMIDAGAGNTITVDFNSGTTTSGDMFVFYDGDQTDSDIATDGQLIGSSSNLGAEFNGSGTITSTGSKMGVKYIVDDGGTGGTFSGNITFN